VKRFATRRARLRASAALLLAVLAIPPTAGAAPTPEEVRACVEGNLARYSDPSTAVAAQYADIETTCRTALEDGSVTVDFAPGGDTRDDEAAASPGSTGGADGGGATPEPSSSGASSGSEGSAGAATGGAPSAPAGAEAPGATDVVAEAIANADAGAGSPLPSSVTDGPGWMLGLLGGAALLVAGAAALAVRRRLN
jgi:hypothetical protein